MTTHWHIRWNENRIGFHQESVHRDLLRFEAEFLSAGPHRVLVPLCGKSVDLPWLASRGHEVIGVEFVPQAVDAFFAELGETPQIEKRGALTLSKAAGITLVTGDIFSVTTNDIGLVDRIWDRAALVALPSDVRVRYTAHLSTLVREEGLLLQNSFEYDDSLMDGPPYSIALSELNDHYGHHDVRLLAEEDTIADEPKFKAKGLSHWFDRTHLVTFSLPGARKIE